MKYKSHNHAFVAERKKPSPLKMHRYVTKNKGKAMSFERYTQEAYGLAHEILDDFSEDEIESIHSSLKRLGIQGWRKWKEENHELIAQYVSAPPSKRKKKKKYVKVMPLIAYASYQYCLAGYYFLCQAEEIQMLVGDSYRNMAATAGKLFNEVKNYYGHEAWPWGDNPFAENT